jgi:hypothetical protein
MPGVIVSYRVANVNAFLKVFEDSAAMRKAAGMHNAALWQAAGDPNHVFIVIEGNDIEQLREFNASDELEQAMKLGGVITPPQVQFLDKVRYFPN